MVFTNKWFAKNQKILLLFANSFIGRRFFRIHGNRSSVCKRRIIRIAPNFIEWQENEKEISIEFRVHSKFSKRIFHGLYPIWWLMHQWDTLFANKFKPVWNLGFDILTAYPDADTETTTVDGDVRRNVYPANESFSTIREGVGNASSDSETTARAYCDYTTGGNQPGWGFFRRIIHLYNTSGLPVSAIISSAICSFTATSVHDDFGDLTLGITSSNPISNTALQNSDYDLVGFGSTDFGNKALNVINADGSTYNDITLNANGLSVISKTGITKFSYRISFDITGIDPSPANSKYSNVTVNTTDIDGTSADPKLVITYTFSGPFPVFKHTP